MVKKFPAEVAVKKELIFKIINEIHFYVNESNKKYEKKKYVNKKTMYSLDCIFLPHFL